MDDPILNESTTQDNILDTAVSAWEPPKPLPDDVLPVEPFDFDLLPETIRPAVQDMSERMQCPPDFIAVGLLVGMASVVGRKACIQPKRKDNWRVLPNLWGAVIGRPSAMKSPALGESIKSLDKLQATACEGFKDAKRTFEVDKDVAASQIKQAKKELDIALKSKNDREKSEANARNNLEKAYLAEEMLEPKLKRYKVVDTTVEALAEILIANPIGVLVYQDELIGLLARLEKEGQENARAFYLQCFDGWQSYTTDRIGRGQNLHIPNPSISLLGSIQPSRLQSYVYQAVTGGNGDDGLMQRFGLLVWPDPIKNWQLVDREPDHEALKAVQDTFARLDALYAPTDAQTGGMIPNIYRFSEAAQMIFYKWLRELKRDTLSGDLHPAIESHLTKYQKLVPALALLFGLIEGEDQISELSITRACAWASYLRSHAERVYHMGMRPPSQGAKALLSRIRKGQITSPFTARDVYRNCWADLADSSAVRSATELLIEHDYLMELPEAKDARGRPSTAYLINPHVLKEGRHE